MKSKSKKPKHEAEASILKSFVEKVDLDQVRAFILEAGVNYLDDEKGDVRHKAKRMSFLNNLIGFVDEVKAWQENNKTL